MKPKTKTATARLPHLRVRLDAEVVEAANTIATARDVSTNAFIAELVTNAVTRDDDERALVETVEKIVKIVKVIAVANKLTKKETSALIEKRVVEFLNTAQPLTAKARQVDAALDLVLSPGAADVLTKIAGR